MGLTSQYLRFAAGPIIGNVVNSEGQARFVKIKDSKDRYVAVTSCEDVILWDLKTKNKLTVCKGDKSEALRICSLEGGLLAVGYADGSIRIFSFEDGSLRVTLQGHKTAITCMVIDPTGSKLVTGGRDGIIIVWDIVNESGLYRLRGHKGPITKLNFLSEAVLVSSSRDTFIKFWDLETQHCFHTLVGHRSEVWDFIIVDSKWLVSGTSSSELTVWKLSFVLGDGTESSSYEEAKRARTESTAPERMELGSDNDDDSEETEGVSPLRCQRIGTVIRQGKGRTCGLFLDQRSLLIGCFGQDHQIELFRMLNEQEMKKKHAKRVKKETKRKAEDADLDVNEDLTVSDLFKRLDIVSCKGKVSCIELYPRSDKLKILVVLKNNSLDILETSIDANKAPAVLCETLRPFGHRTDVRTLCFTSDNAGILSASGEQLKLWNGDSLQCIRSLDCEYALCSGFLLGDRHCVIGTKSGKIQLFDLASGELVETIDAHEGSCWTICFTPDKKKLVSGGSDKIVKFWSVEIDKETRRFTLSLQKCLELQEEILCLKISPNGKLLAAALSDNTVKVFFMDTLKFFLSLYGHQYPVLCMDISDDSNLLVSGSSDRNVKIWGLDFGDCHKSLFAHTDSVIGVQFVPKSHQFFSVGKDKMLKHWDADNFQRIITLEGHQSEVWALAISPNGKHVVTAGHDKSIRIWDKTDEPLILEEQREIEREEEAEKEIDTEEGVIPREGQDEVGMAGKKTLVTVKCAERLLEALEVFDVEAAKEYEAKRTGAKQEAPHVLLMVHRTTCRFKYIREEVKRITAGEMEETLMVLPFKQVLQLLEILIQLVEKRWDIEYFARTMLFLLRIHSGQLLATPATTKIVSRAHEIVRPAVDSLVDMVGFNLQAMSFIKQEFEDHNEESFFADATQNLRKKKHKQDRIKDQTVVLSVS